MTPHRRRGCALERFLATKLAHGEGLMNLPAVRQFNYRLPDTSGCAAGLRPEMYGQ